MLLAALYIQRSNFEEAIKLLKISLDVDWKNTSSNLLMGIIYDKLDRPGLSRKHFAIVKCKKLRELNLLPPKSTQPKNFRTLQMEYKVEIVDFKNIMSKDQQLSFDQSDVIYYDFIDELIQNYIYDLADFSLDYIKDKTTTRFLMTQAKIRVQ